jgi:hypothetical protein
MAVHRADPFPEPLGTSADDPAVRLHAAETASDQGDKIMKAPTALAVVLPSLVIASCVADMGPAGHSRAELDVRAEDRVAIGALLAAHNDYLSHMRNSGGSPLRSSVNCN